MIGTFFIKKGSKMKKVTLYFPNGGFLAKSVMKTEVDVRVDALVPVEVPTAYGTQLIEDGFARRYEDSDNAEKKPAKPSTKENKSTTQEQGLSDATLLQAEENVQNAEAALAAAMTDEDKAEAKQKLDEAQGFLAGLKG